MRRGAIGLIMAGLALVACAPDEEALDTSAPVAEPAAEVAAEAEAPSDPAPEVLAEAALAAPAPEFEYLGVETRLLDNELANFHLRMRGARDQTDIEAYARCAAAQYTLIRGYPYLRHVRTTVQEQGGLWRADAVYTVSPTLPRGVQTINAEMAVADCTELGIPTV